MKAFLILMGVIGAAIYGVLIFTHDALTDGNTEKIDVGQAQANVVRPLNSWDSYLPTRTPGQNPQFASSQSNPEPSNAVATNLERQQHSEASSSKSNDNAPVFVKDAAEPVEWAKVVLAAQTHSQASVSAPALRYYRPGTALQVLRREGVWIQVSDPMTQERGWVLDQYLSSIAGQPPKQVATESATEPERIKPALPKSKRTRSAKTTVRSHGVAVANADPWNNRWGGRYYRRRGFGLFMFHPFGRFAAGR